MAIAGSQYTKDFTAAANQNPFPATSGETEPWAALTSAMQINNGAGQGMRPAVGGVTAFIYYNVLSTADIVKAKITVTTNIAATGGDLLGPTIFTAAGVGYILSFNGTADASIRKRTTATGIGTAIGTGFTVATTANSTYELWYNKTNGELTCVVNDVVVTTRTDTDYQASQFYLGTFGDPQNTNGKRIGSFGADLSDSAVTIDDTDADTRVTEPRTVRITVDSTAPTTANTNIYIDADTNDAIVPDSCTLVSGTTYDIVFTVPDQYAGLPYDEVGYPIIVSTADGDATSGDVPYLPVTGNDFVVLTAAPGAFGTSLGTLAIGDIIEWDNIDEITVNSDGTITSTNPNTTFEARAWDATDSTYGAWALQTLGSGGGGETEGLTLSGLTTVGLTITGLTS